MHQPIFFEEPQQAPDAAWMGENIDESSDHRDRKVIVERIKDAQRLAYYSRGLRQRPWQEGLRAQAEPAQQALELEPSPDLVSDEVGLNIKVLDKNNLPRKEDVMIYRKDITLMRKDMFSIEHAESVQENDLETANSPFVVGEAFIKLPEPLLSELEPPGGDRSENDKPLQNDSMEHVGNVPKDNFETANSPHSVGVPPGDERNYDFLHGLGVDDFEDEYKDGLAEDWVYVCTCDADDLRLRVRRCTLVRGREVPGSLDYRYYTAEAALAVRALQRLQCEGVAL